MGAEIRPEIAVVISVFFGFYVRISMMNWSEEMKIEVGLGGEAWNDKDRAIVTVILGLGKLCGK